MVAVVAIAIFARHAPADDQDGGDHGRNDQLQLVEATLPQLSQALRSHLVTTEQLVQMYQARIAAYDKTGPTLNAILHLNEHALDDARAVDHERRHGGDRGPMFGIPILLKDNIDTDDQPTTAGSVALAGSIPPRDSFITNRLREAGAVIIGKATLTEFANFIAIGMPSGYSSLGGYGLNPYDPRPLPGGDGRPVLTPGGSSSGPGIAVAANLTAIAIGTETSGSILSPSSSNGVAGIKPTRGLVSRTGILPITANQDTAGPIARTVTDAAILLGVIAGFDRDDPATLPCLVPGNCFRDYTRFLDKHALRGARIAVPHTPYWIGFTPAQTQIMNDAIAAMRAEGAFVDDPHEIPNQADISAFGICTSVPAPTNCSTVLLYGQKLHDRRHHRVQQRACLRRAQVRPGPVPGRRRARHQSRQRRHPAPDRRPHQGPPAHPGRDRRLARRPRRHPRHRRRLRRDPVPAEPRRRGARQGRLSERGGPRRFHAADRARRQPAAVRHRVHRPRVQRAPPHRPGVRVRAGDASPHAARERAAAAERHRHPARQRSR
ncbi:MAG: hypothetical protein E6J90_21195 [Deltaproteobacteria bacterium]|nr:MAG: hypothetical protein E6J90_21195 [Deltaproteobacteria bacterium]